MFKKILLIKPSFRESHYQDIGGPQQGLGYISESLLKYGIENIVIDMGLGCGRAELDRRIKEYNPDLIGISIWTFRFPDTYELINKLKFAFPSIQIIVGGPHVSTMRASVLEECQEIDYGVVGEGEEAIVELCKGIPPKKIKGLLYRDKDQIIFSGDRICSERIDEFSFPTYRRFELEKYGKIISVVTSRGCPYQCIFCPVAQTIGRKFRARNSGQVGEEFAYWYKKGYREFTISDDNFTLVKDRVYEICNELERRRLQGINISLRNGIRADRVDKKLLGRMAEVGFKYIAIGVEAGNNRILENLKKGERIEDIELAIKEACNLNYMVTLFFLLGSPGESEADVYDSLRLAVKYPVYDVRFYNLIPFPGSELFDWVKSNGYLLVGVEKYVNEILGNASHWINEPVFETPELSKEKRKELFRKTNEIVKWHTLPVKHKFHRNAVAAKFQELHFPSPASLALADLYFSRPVQKSMASIEWLKDLKARVSRR